MSSKCYLLFIGLSALIGMFAANKVSSQKYYLKNLKNQSAQSSDPCYDEDRPRRCMPDFVNAAFGLPIEASSVCGKNKVERYCDLKDPFKKAEQFCDVCDDSDPIRRFSPLALTDVHNTNNVTCWRSEPRPNQSGLDSSPDNVTLTLSLGKKFELTYISLVFCPFAIRPDSIALYKSVDFGKIWQPFQFYSSQCRKLYGRPTKATVSKNNEQEARCVDHHRFSGDGTGFQGTRIAFSTLEGRPSAADFDSSPVLQDWVTATDIRVIFHRLQNPLSQLSGSSPYYYESQKSGANKYSTVDAVGKVNDSKLNIAGVGTYALSDFAVGGRCKCNGHASRCLKGRDGQLECECKHNTAGRDCERCKPFHFDRPWSRGTVREVNECKGKQLIFIFPLSCFFSVYENKIIFSFDLKWKDIFISFFDFIKRNINLFFDTCWPLYVE
jgi:netrin 1